MESSSDENSNEYIPEELILDEKDLFIEIEPLENKKSILQDKKNDNFLSFEIREINQNKKDKFEFFFESYKSLSNKQDNFLEKETYWYQSDVLQAILIKRCDQFQELKLAQSKRFLRVGKNETNTFSCDRYLNQQFYVAIGDATDVGNEEAKHQNNKDVSYGIDFLSLMGASDNVVYTVCETLLTDQNFLNWNLQHCQQIFFTQCKDVHHLSENAIRKMRIYAKLGGDNCALYGFKKKEFKKIAGIQKTEWEKIETYDEKLFNKIQQIKNQDNKMAYENLLFNAQEIKFLKQLLENNNQAELSEKLPNCCQSIQKVKEVLLDAWRSHRVPTVFSEVLPLIVKENSEVRQARVILPLNIRSGHWISLEIVLFYDPQTKHLKTDIWQHDPYGGNGKMINLQTYEEGKFRQQLELVLKDELAQQQIELNQNNPIEIVFQESPYQQRQQDGSSCGAITIEDIVLLAQGNTLNERLFRIGAPNLRQQHQFIYNQLQKSNTKIEKSKEENITDKSDKSVNVLRTKGDGNCFFHATFGESNGFQIECKTGMDYREKWHKALAKYNSLADKNMPKVFYDAISAVFLMFLEDPTVVPELEGNLLKNLCQQTHEIMAKTEEHAECSRASIYLGIENEKLGTKQIFIQIIQGLLNTEESGKKHEIIIKNLKEYCKQNNIRSDQSEKLWEARKTLFDLIKGDCLKDAIFANQQAYFELYVLNYRQEDFDKNLAKQNFLSNPKLYQCYLNVIKSQFYYIFIQEIPMFANLFNVTITVQQEDIDDLLFEPGATSPSEFPKRTATIFHAGLHYSKVKVNSPESQQFNNQNNKSQEKNNLEINYNKGTSYKKLFIELDKNTEKFSFLFNEEKDSYTEANDISECFEIILNHYNFDQKIINKFLNKNKNYIENYNFTKIKENICSTDFGFFQLTFVIENFGEKNEKIFGEKKCKNMVKIVFPVKTYEMPVNYKIYLKRASIEIDQEINEKSYDVIKYDILCDFIKNNQAFPTIYFQNENIKIIYTMKKLEEFIEFRSHNQGLKKDSNEKQKVDDTISVNHKLKFHICLPEKNETQFKRGWEIIAICLMKTEVNHFKIVRRGYKMSGKEFQAGKDITIYADANPDFSIQKWYNIIYQITHQLVQNKIDPGYKQQNDQKQRKKEYEIKFTSYVSYRYDGPNPPQEYLFKNVELKEEIQNQKPPQVYSNTSSTNNFTSHGTNGNIPTKQDEDKLSEDSDSSDDKTAGKGCCILN